MHRVLLVIVALASSIALAGPLTPPAGPVVSTTGPEPRTPIDAAHTPGDADSVFKITAPGSYYLADNVAGASGKLGIEIASSGVTIDLMGFRLQGAAGSLNGIATTGGTRTQIVVRNGTISAWGLSGIDLTVGGIGSDCTIENIHAITNGVSGIVAFNRAAIRDCVARGNSGQGINTTADAVVNGCVSAQNGGSGIVVGASSSVVSCSARENTAAGISAASGCVIAECAAHLNGSSGIAASTAANIRGCSSYDNGSIGISTGLGSTVQHSTATSNGSHGIFVSSGCVVQHCTSSSNGGHGIAFSGDSLIAWNTCDGNGTVVAGSAGLFTASTQSRIDSNHCTDNDYGIRISGISNIVIRNTCSGNTTSNWDVVASNHILVINAQASPSAITTNAGGIGFGSSDPNANFSGN